MLLYTTILHIPSRRQFQIVLGSVSLLLTFHFALSGSICDNKNAVDLNPPHLMVPFLRRLNVVGVHSSSRYYAKACSLEVTE